MDNKRVHILISGIVQGVFFRYTTRVKAEELNIKGWARNCSDGRVEALFEGDALEIKKMVAWCHQGPPGARVDDVSVEEEDYRGEFDSFFIE